MVINIFLDKKQLITANCNKYEEICACIEEVTHLKTEEYFLVANNGKRLSAANTAEIEYKDVDVHCVLRQCGGKGGFGSMLRAIGAQIEKTTNREACRDLSGRRLRDINEEKRVRAWLDKQGEREREAEERKKRKIEKLLMVPKHDFKDKEYEEARAKLTEKVNDAFEEGLKQSEEVKLSASEMKDSDKASTSSSIIPGTKRKMLVDDKAKAKKKKKGALWIGDDISGTDTDSEDTDEEVNAKTVKAVI